MRCVVLILILASSVLCSHDECAIDTAERYAKSIFNAVDAGFSRMIFIHDPNNPLFNQTLDKIMALLSPDFIYTINGHVVTGRDAIYGAVLGMLAKYIIRETHPPQPSIYPYGSYSSHSGIQRAHLTGKVMHTFTNLTGTFMDWNTHEFNVEKMFNGNWLMVNATLDTYLIIRS